MFLFGFLSVKLLIGGGWGAWVLDARAGLRLLQRGMHEPECIVPFIASCEEKIKRYVVFTTTLGRFQHAAMLGV
jgi:hypothetical protein